MSERDAHPPIHERETGWQAISPAQQTETLIWLCDDQIARVGLWKDGSWVDQDGRDFTFTPTHWKPRP